MAAVIVEDAAMELRYESLSSGESTSASESEDEVYGDAQDCLLPNDTEEGYLARLATFQGYRERCPYPRELALAGFSYDAVNKQVFCSICGLQLVTPFTDSFEPLAVHQTYSIRCHILGQDPVGDLGVSSLRPPPVNPEYVRMHITAPPRSKVDEDRMDELRAAYQQAIDFNFDKQVRQMAPHMGYDPKDMRIEVSRRDTMKKYDWMPKHDREILASQGFFDLGYDGEHGAIAGLKCQFCRIAFSIDPDIDAIAVTESHLKKNCALLNGTDDTNVKDFAFHVTWDKPKAKKPSLANDIILEDMYGMKRFNAKYPRLARTETRLSMFLTCPDAPYPPARSLSKAGYYYYGLKGMKCFYCGVISKDWSPLEDPWNRHARESPDCNYLALEKGPLFAQHVIEQFGPYIPSAAPLRTVDEGDVADLVDSSPVKDVISAGFLDEDSAKKVVRRRLESGKRQCRTMDEVVKDYNKMKEKERASNKIVPYLPRRVQQRLGTRPKSPRRAATAVGPRSPHGSPRGSPRRSPRRSPPGTGAVEYRTPPRGSPAGQSPPRTAAAYGTPPGGSPAAHSSPSGPAAYSTPVRTRQHRRTEESLDLSTSKELEYLCKICMNEVVGCMYYPCKHWVCCMKCAYSLRRCPICRVRILKAVKVDVTF